MGMIYDLTTPDPDILEKIAAQVGSAPRSQSRDSHQLRIASASSTIFALLDIGTTLPACTMEMREQGLLLHFQSQGQSKVWVVPYWQLHIQHNAGKLSLFAGEHQMRLEGVDGAPIDRSSVATLYERMAKSTGQDNDIYGGKP